MASFDFTTISNVDYIDEMYARYQQDPNSLDREWAVFFAGFDLGSNGASSKQLSSDPSDQEDRGVYALIHAYRSMGHLVANLDPLSYTRPPQPLLEHSQYGFSDSDLDQPVGKGDFQGPTDGTLRDLINKLKRTYCDSIGIEFTDIPYKKQREWLQAQMEPVLNRPKFSQSQCKGILFQLMAAEGFEQYLHISN